MDIIKVNQLNTASNINYSDVLPIVNNNATRKISVEQLSTLFGFDTMGDSYLAKDNVSTYVPSNDYNPSTKKYANDTIGGAITTFSNAFYQNIITRLSNLVSIGGE